jgi:hypothetical protein
MTLRKAIGWALLSLPFIGIFSWIYFDQGIKGVLFVAVIGSIIAGSIVGGIKLVGD